MTFCRSFHYHAALMKWHKINKTAACVNFFTNLIADRRNMFVRSKVRINLNSKQFFVWTWFYQVTINISFFSEFWSFKMGLFYPGLAFIWLSSSHLKSLLTYLKFRNNSINIGRTSVLKFSMSESPRS